MLDVSASVVLIFLSSGNVRFPRCPHFVDESTGFGLYTETTLAADAWTFALGVLRLA